MCPLCYVRLTRRKNDLWDAVRAFLDPIPASPAAPVPAPPSPKLQIHTPVAVRFDDARAPRIPLAGGKRKRRRSSEGGLEDEEELVSGRSRSDSSEGSEGGYVRIVPMVLVTPPEPAPAPSGLVVLSSTYARPPLSVRGVCGADLSVGYIGFRAYRPKHQS
jgi:hypothetical protein